MSMLILFLKALAILHVAGLVACVAMLNMDRFDDIKRNLAVGMLLLFASGAGLIFLLEEMQPFIWEAPAPAKNKKKKGAEGTADTGNRAAGKKRPSKTNPRPIRMAMTVMAKKRALQVTLSLHIGPRMSCRIARTALRWCRWRVALSSWAPCRTRRAPNRVKRCKSKTSRFPASHWVVSR